jgi:phosphoglycerate dehydrogenase-like enzyme
VKKTVYLVDPDIHASMRESLRDLDPERLALAESPGGVSALVTQNRDIDAGLLEESGPALEAIFVLEPGSASVAPTHAPQYRLENAALTGVAEHTVFLMLALTKRAPWVLEQARKRAWVEGVGEPKLTNQRDYAYNWIGHSGFGMLAHRTVGLVGFGTIARATARILRGFSANILYYKPKRLSEDEEKTLGVAFCPLERLLQESDFVSLHHRFIDGPDGNDMQFGRAEFERMKPTAFFVNTARGRMVDEEALCHAIEAGEIQGAALDVFRLEPLPAEHPFFRLPSDKMILTPHLAGVPMREAADTMTRQILRTLASVADTEATSSNGTK